MRHLLAPILLCVLGVALAVPAYALDDVILKDGRVRRANLLEVLEDGIRVKFTPKGGGTATMTVPASKLDPHYFYNLRDKAVGDDAKGHLKLALWAIDQGMFSRAKIQVQRATELDPQLVKDIREGHLPEIREGIAERVLKSAESDIKEGLFDNAEKKLEALLVRMPDTEAGTNAIEVYQSLTKTKADYEAKKEQEELDRMAEEEQKKEKALRKRVEPIKKDLTKGKELLQEGLVEDSEQKALKLLRDAINKGEAGLKKIEKLQKDFSDDADLMAKADEVTGRVIAGMVNAYLKRADIYTWRGSTTNARKEVEKARKLDPDNPDIAAAEQRADDQDDQNALDLRWQRNRREGMRFRGGGRGGGARGGGGRGGGGGGRKR